jgi:hypothetical protein
VNIVKVFYCLSMLGIGVLTGCGGVEVEPAASEESMQVMTQSLCDSPPSIYTTHCKSAVQRVPAGMSCNNYGFEFSHVCTRSLIDDNCQIFHCSKSGVWEIKNTGYSCQENIELFCS